MEKSPKETETPEEYKLSELFKTLTDFGSKLGSDALIFTLVTLAAFAALWKGADAALTVFAAIVILLLWLANKVINAYLEERRSDARLKELKAIEGRKLLAKFRRRQSLTKSDSPKS